MIAAWGVLVVEDDPMVASVHCGVVRQTPGLSLLGVAVNAAQGQAYVEAWRPALVLLDLGLPGTSGIALLRWIRAEPRPVEVIAVTAVSSASAVRSVLHLGALDYLVKPFTLERLEQALAAFIRKMTLLRPRQLGQEAVDALRSSSSQAGRALPKNLSQDRLDKVRHALAAATGPVTAEEVAAHLAIARVTARRYLEYLVTMKEASVSAIAFGPGRPRKTYLVSHPETIADGFGHR